MHHPTILAIAGTAALLAACGPSPSPSGGAAVSAKPRPDLVGYRTVEKKALLARLKDPKSAVISGDFMSDNASGQPTLCGYVNSRNAFGGMSGPQRFISGGAVGLEEDFAPGEMDQAWAMLCAQPIKEEGR